MPLNRTKLYSILLIACGAGYIWLYFSLSTNYTKNNRVSICIIKQATDIPCPSCGSTRSIICLAKGNFKGALLINPLGYIVAFIMLISPLWIAIDFATNKKTLFDFYKKIEINLQKPRYAIPLILLVVCNWIWNITKGL